MTGMDIFVLFLLYALFVTIVAGLTEGEAWEDVSKLYNYGIWKEAKNIVKAWNIRSWVVPFAYVLVLFFMLWMFILSGYILALPFKLLGFLLFKKDGA